MKKLELDHLRMVAAETRIEKLISMGACHIANYRLLNALGIDSTDSKTIGSIKSQLDLAKVRLMTEGRKRAVRIFHKQFSDEQFAEICKKTASSDFLCCRGSKSAWKASFDFLIKPSNAVKVLEGNYDNRTTESVTDRWN